MRIFFYRHQPHFLAILLPVLCLTGCSSEPEYTLVPAQGILKINGQPAADISVQFLPNILAGTKGPTSFASTDKDGKFVLTTMDGQPGAVAGNHMVVLADMNEERPAQGQVAKTLPRLDSKYTIATKERTYDVKVSGEPIVIEISSR